MLFPNWLWLRSVNECAVKRTVYFWPLKFFYRPLRSKNIFWHTLLKDEWKFQCCVAIFFRNFRKQLWLQRRVDNFLEIAKIFSNYVSCVSVLALSNALILVIINRTNRFKIQKMWHFFHFFWKPCLDVSNLGSKFGRASQDVWLQRSEVYI